MCPKLKVSIQVREMRYVHGADELWSTAGIRDYGFTCDGSGKIWDREFRVTLGDGKYWSIEWLEQHGARCAVSGKFWPKKVMVQKGDKWVHVHSADRYDDAGNEVTEIQPMKKRGRSKKIVGLDPGNIDVTAMVTLDGIRGQVADAFIIDDPELLRPNPINALILRRRVA
jgi:hypothetical protein